MHQEFEEDGVVVQRSIAFASRVLMKSENNYSITELEALAIVWAFQTFRFFLYGKQTKVFTDHRALEFLMSTKLTHERLRRWALLLQEYNFTVVYIPGAQYIVADTLSRAPRGLTQSQQDKSKDTNFSLLYIQKVGFENFVTASLKDIAAEQDRDLTWKDIKEKWKDQNNTAIRHFYWPGERYYLKDLRMTTLCG